MGRLDKTASNSVDYITGPSLQNADASIKIARLLTPDCKLT